MNDDDNNGLPFTEKQRIAACQAMYGDYKGNFIYAYKKDTVSKADSANIEWTINSDTIITIKDFPVSIFAESITDSTLAKAIASLPNQDIRVYYMLTDIDPNNFILNPVIPIYNLTYDGIDHKVQIVMIVNNYNSCGIYYPGSKTMQMQIYEVGIYINGKLNTSLLNSAIPYVFKGTKQ